MTTSFSLRVLGLVLSLAFIPSAACAQDRTVVVHDPVIAEENGTYYMFHTGNGIGVKTSSDLQSWKNAGAVFRDMPGWVRETVPKVGRDLWAPDIFKHDGTWYLFASWDRCCRGVDSTYKVIVGRSRDIRGPYLDRDGKRLVRGGGTVIASGDGENWAAIGHPSAYTFDDTDYLVAHAYDLKDRGAPKLRVRPIKWEDGWPSITLGE